MKPRILDLFCCEGGAGKGFSDAGFDVVGVDLIDQPRYPFDFLRADAFIVLRDFLFGHRTWQTREGRFLRLEHFDAIHASPPCQAYSKAHRLRGNEHARLIAETRKLLERTGLPYVIENVVDARAELRDPQMLCGTMFGLRLYRHRLFETNWPLTVPLHGEHYLPQVKMGRSPEAHHMLQPVGNFAGVAEAREAMGMPWASRDGLREAIPPAYTEWVGEQLMAEIQHSQLRANTPAVAALGEEQS